MLEVQELKKAYGSIKAVDGLSLRVEKGMIFGLLGPNGAGKTTTIECIIGTRKADSGRIRLLGRDIRSFPKSMYEKIGVQFQDSRYPDRIRVDELLRMNSALFGKPPADTGRLLKQFSLEDRLRHPVDRLSGGERQKLSVVLALLNNPEVVFLDELTTGLDPQARRDVWDHIEQLKDRGLTIILTSHFMDEVSRLCGKILIMNKGREVVSGSPGEVTAVSGKKTLEDAYLYFTAQKEKNDESLIHTV